MSHLAADRSHVRAQRCQSREWEHVILILEYVVTEQGLKEKENNWFT